MTEQTYKCAVCNTYFILQDKKMIPLTEPSEKVSSSFCSYDCYATQLDMCKIQGEARESLLEKFIKEREN